LAGLLSVLGLVGPYKMVHCRLAITVAAILMMMSLMPADAAKKKKPKYRAPDTATSLFLDGPQHRAVAYVLVGNFHLR